MKKISALLFVLGFILITGCEVKKETKSPSGIHWENVSDNLIERMNLQLGERVLLIAEPGRFDSLVTLLTDKIKSRQANYLGTISIDSIQPLEWQTGFTQTALSLDSVQLIEHFATVDLGIMLPGALPIHKPYAALQEVLKKGKGRTIHFHWSGAFDADGNPVAIHDSIDSFYQHALLTTDYAALATLQQKFETAAQNQWIEISTPEGTRLQFQITGRPVTKQDGDASLARSQKAITLIDREIELPAGAIRVAPLEETVEGVIVFPPSVWNGQLVTGLTVNFQKGKITSVKASEGEDAVRKELEEGGEAARSFRELALGFNPKLVPESGHSWIPYYGYGAGVVRLSLGDNSELNGNVRGPYVRWNFFTNATVKVGGDLWVADGKLLIER